MKKRKAGLTFKMKADRTSHERSAHTKTISSTMKCEWCYYPSKTKIHPFCAKQMEKIKSNSTV